MKRFLSAVVVSLVLVGCGTTMGTKIDNNDISFVQKGKTTKAQLVDRFGTPTNTTVDSDGREIMSWVHSASTTDAKTYIPIAGAFIGGGSVKTNTFTAICKKGVVIDYNLSSGQQDYKLGAQ